MKHVLAEMYSNIEACFCRDVFHYCI